MIKDFFPTNIKLPFQSFDEGHFYVYDTIVNDSDKKLELFYILNDFFADDRNQEKHLKYYATLWEWYVFLFWETIKFLDEKMVINTFAHQLVDATQLGIDVQDSLFKAISNITPDPEEMQSFYSNIKKEIQNCTEKIVTSKGLSQYSIKDIYDKKVFFKQNKNLDLDYVEFKTKVHDSIFSVIRNEKYRFFETDKAYNLFLNMINFFIDIEPQEINEFIFAFDHKMDIIRDQNLSEEYGDEVEESDEINIPEQTTYSTIKSQLEQQFSYDTDGELQPVEDVLSKLSELAQENDDVQIEELYFFDENIGKFIWNEDLLNTK
ncbi:MAG: hypothetical protein WC025_03580 [Candidatus Magasanikbacteria bacterium]